MKNKTPQSIENKKSNYAIKLSFIKNAQLLENDVKEKKIFAYFTSKHIYITKF